MNKLFDLRFVIGAFFLVVGVLLLIYSFIIDEEAAQTINRWCGSIFSVFGIFMLTISFRKEADDELLPEE